MTGFRKGWFFIIFALFLALTVALPVRAQTPTPATPRDALIQAIEAQAQRNEQQGTKESTEGLNLLFGEQARDVGLTLPEVKQIYEDAYSASAAARPWWQPYLPSLGWIAAILALLAAIFRGAIEDAGKKLVTSLGESLYNRFAGSKPFWRLALGRYKASLFAKHHELKLPFRPGRPLPMKEIYVPVKVRERDELTDAYQAIEKHKKLVVLGAPGAGKSILLRHVALTYAERDLDAPLVPVLIELNRLNEAGTNMLAHLAAILKQNDFPNGETFLKSWLKTGQLLLMFDGLDEVNTDRREPVSTAIRDLLAEYPGCHAIVTCRTQVYKGEFADWADQTLEVAEFSDQQIQRFLFAWQKELPPDKSVEHLWTNLSERPRILALARNPLMLTIIAFLYADTEFVLPYSRAEFYDTAVTVLLEQWKEKRSRYKAASKRLVMRHLALFMQDTAPERGQERRTIDLPVLLAEIKKSLPALNLKDEDAGPLLDEIVERSGLMIGLEGGLKYQFTHLTLQEFFAAQALGDDYQGLLRRFKADPDAWREVVKLWCGLEHKSTALLNELYTLDRQTALECLADAQNVESTLADKMVEEFKERILTGDVNETILHSIANIVSGPGSRGDDLEKFLYATIRDNNLAIGVIESAAKILVFTNLPINMAFVTSLGEFNQNIHPFLVSLGDRVVPFLENDFIFWGKDWAIDVLFEIGTPLAAKALVNGLWREGSDISFKSAWFLADLLSRPDIEAELNTIKLDTKQINKPKIDWAWEPFEADPNHPLRIIAGRIVFLISNTSQELFSKFEHFLLKIDTRLVPSLFLILPKPLEKISYAADVERFERTYFAQCHPVEKKIYGMIENSYAFSLMRMSSDDLFSHKVSIQDWRDIFKKQYFDDTVAWQKQFLVLWWISIAIVTLLSGIYLLSIYNLPLLAIIGTSLMLYTTYNYVSMGNDEFLPTSQFLFGLFLIPLSYLTISQGWVISLVLGVITGGLIDVFYKKYLRMFGEPFLVFNFFTATGVVFCSALVHNIIADEFSTITVSVFIGLMLYLAYEAFRKTVNWIGAILFFVFHAGVISGILIPTWAFIHISNITLLLAYFLTWLVGGIISFRVAVLSQRSYNPLDVILLYIPNAPQQPRQKRSWLLDFLPSRLLRR